jgi:hypothetical protein
MPSLRAPVSEVGWRSRAFSLVVLVTLGLFGVVGVVLLWPEWFARLLGAETAGHISQHLREPHHRVHDLTFSFLVGAALAGMLAQLRRPSQNVAGMLMALIPWVALLLAAALSATPIQFAPLPILGALTLLATILHPTERDLFRSFSVSRVNRMMLALVIVATVPLLAFASSNIGLQRTLTNEHAALGHYGFMAAFSFTAIGVGLLASLRPDGWRLTAWIAGLLPALLGIASLVFPDVDSSLGPTWGVAAIAWGIVFVAAAESVRRADRAVQARLMANQPPSDETGAEPRSRSSTGTRWVYVFGIVVFLLALLVVIVHLTGGGFRGH